MISECEEKMKKTGFLKFHLHSFYKNIFLLRIVFTS